MSYPDNNPKTLVGAGKVPLHLVPPSATHYLALALADGAAKYGPYNWRESRISVSTYKAAAQRHWDAFRDGEDNAADSGVHHLAHAMACCALLLDAMTVGKLVDDRPTPGAVPRLQQDFAATNRAKRLHDDALARAAAVDRRDDSARHVDGTGPDFSIRADAPFAGGFLNPED